MKEQSQIDDMRAAIRGDLERGRKRRPRPSPTAQPPEPAEPDPPADDEARPGFLSSFFKRS